MFKISIALFVLLLAGSCFANPTRALRDPTRPAGIRTTASKDSTNSNDITFKLTSIIIDKKFTRALINGEYRKVGDKILGAKLINISANQVVLQEDDHKTILTLIPLNKIMNRSKKKLS